MFCDLVDSTHLTEVLDPEDLHSVLNRFESAGREVVVERLDGYLAQVHGDGLLVYFGYPTAHEDDARRALCAGLEILDKVHAINPILLRDHNVRLVVKIGVATGMCVIGELSTGEILAFGEAPHLAARLQEVAEHLDDAADHGAVVASASTQQLVEGYFDLRDLGLCELKGKRFKAAFQVLKERIARTRLDLVGRMGLTPFVGREVEARVLRDCWDRVTREGQGHVALVCGEAGIGKSRLVRMLEEDVTRDSNNWLTPSAASPYHQNTAFYPLIDLLERVVLQVGADEGAEQKWRKLEDWLLPYERHGLPLTETLPLLSRLLSLPVDGHHPATEHNPSVERDPQAEKLRTMDVLLQILFARAAEQPVLFVCEDLHWADPSTLDLFTMLVQRVPGAQVLVVLTFRPEFTPPPWIKHGYVTQVTLDRLGRDPSAEIVKVAAGGRALPQALLEQILSWTNGNPLFIEELTRMVKDSGLLKEVDGRFELVRPLTALKIPTTLQGSLTARLDSLGSAKEVAQLGSAIGREFSYELLRAVSPLDDQALGAALADMVGAEFLYQSGLPPKSRYIFKHALIQEAAYDAMLRSTRQEQHRRIADVLTERFPEVAEKQPELIARHYTEAELSAQAIPFWQRAGQRALERAANVEAIASLQRALALLTVQPPSPSRDQTELEIQFGLAPAYMAIRGWASTEVERTCQRTRELSDLRGDFRGTYGSLWGLWTNYFLRARLGEALTTGQQVLQLAESVEVPASAGPSRWAVVNLRVMAHHAVGYSHFYRGEFSHAREHAEAGLALQIQGAQCAFNLEAEREIVRSFQFSSSAALRMMQGCALWMLGYPDRAPAVVDSAIALTQELGHYPSQAYALASSLLLDHYRLDVEHAAAIAEQLLKLAQDQAFEIWSPFALMFQGWVRAERGQVDEGIAQTRQGLNEWRATGSYLNQTIVTAMLARSLRKAGRLDEVLEILDIEIGEARSRAELQFAPELYRLKGDVLLDRGLVDEGQLCLEQALSLAREQDARMLELRAATSLVRLSERAGQSGAARSRLADLYSGFTEGFSTPDLRAARELL